MWTVTINNQDDTVADVTATYTSATDSFSWNSTIKKSEASTFVTIAKAELAKYLTKQESIDTFKTTLETSLNA